MILLHSCLGLPSNRRAIESALTSEGYVALFVDDFSTRGLKETCAVDFPDGLADAYGALAFVARLPFVDPARVAAVGFSQGADTALKIAVSRSASALPDGLGFRSAAAFYPPCLNVEGERLAIPTLILVGAADGVTPAADCERLAKSNPGKVRLVVYPDAAHCFDDPAFAGGKSVMGMILKYDAEAAKRSRRDLGGFLAETRPPAAMKADRRRSGLADGRNESHQKRTAASGEFNDGSRHILCTTAPTSIPSMTSPLYRIAPLSTRTFRPNVTDARSASFHPEVQRQPRIARRNS